MLLEGAGVKSAGIARDATGHFLRLALYEKGDMGEGCALRDAGLVHRGLGYVANCEFRLKWQPLKERVALLGITLNIIGLRHFMLPHQKTRKKRDDIGPTLSGLRPFSIPRTAMRRL